MTDAMKKMLTKAATTTRGCPDCLFGAEIFKAKCAGWVEGKHSYTTGGNSRTHYVITDAGRAALAA